MHKIYFFCRIHEPKEGKRREKKTCQIHIKDSQVFQSCCYFCNYYYCWAFYRLLLFKLNQGDLMLVYERYNGSF